MNFLQNRENVLDKSQKHNVNLECVVLAKYLDTSRLVIYPPVFCFTSHSWDSCILFVHWKKNAKNNMSLQHFRLCVDTASCPRTLTSRNGTVTCDCTWIIPLLVDTALYRSDLFFPQLPQCLCIHIQRTYWHTNGIPYKNNAFIKFPEFLDMEPFLYEPLEQHSRQNGTERKFFPTTAGNGDLNGYLDELVGSFAAAGNKRWAWNVFVVTTAFTGA